MATIVAPPSQLPSRSTTPPSNHAHLTLNTSFGNLSSHQPLPNKHIPYCSPGPVPSGSLPSPPNSPPSASTLEAQTSLLHPPTSFKAVLDDPPVYALSPQNLTDAIEHIAARPLPEAKYVFPWLHGLNGENHFQCAFFNARRRAARAVPVCLRAVTIVKAGGDLSHSRLVGALAPEEILESADLSPTATERAFLDIDPREGFSVRNFQIQACKLATVSDIVVYGDDRTPKEEVISLAQSISQAQAQWQNGVNTTSTQPDRFSTFVLTGTFADIESTFPHIVSVGQDGRLTGHILDFAYQERLEMCQLSKASQIAPNVFLGPTPDPNVYEPAAMREAESQFDLLIEATDIAIIPDAELLKRLESYLEDTRGSRKTPAKLEFPGSGSIAAHTCNMADLDRFVGFCKWIYRITTTPGPAATKKDGDVEMSDSDKTPLRVLFHCTDGYTETTLFAIAYSMFTQGISAEAAWIRLHKDMERNFFAYSTDKVLLEKLQRRLLRESPVLHPKDRCSANQRSAWMEQMDGSLPSRILPYLYLGNLTHAQNPGLLKELGISQVLSVGEPIRWEQEDTSTWGDDKFLFIDNVQDNGVDALTTEFDAALKFIAKAKANGMATLVHCRVGVSRSATIVIAEVMQQLGLSFPRAYCFVRARRLNVIVQPHLRFCYELLKWEELQAQKRGVQFRRELEWANIAREIALINKPYCKT